MVECDILCETTTTTTTTNDNFGNQILSGLPRGFPAKISSDRCFVVKEIC